MGHNVEPRSTTRDPIPTILSDTLDDRIGAQLARKEEVLRKHGAEVLCEVTVAQAYGGMRGVKCMVTETSAVDPYDGIRFRGYSIPELRERLPKAPRGGEEPLPEGVFWLLLTGDIPSRDEVAEITDSWRAVETLPRHVEAVLDAMPVNTHPMTQLSQGILAMQPESIFACRYRQGLAKGDMWRATLADAMVLLARLPVLAAYVYRRSYRSGDHVPPGVPSLDWSANLTRMMGFDDASFADLMRLYLSIHADHEGGNVSAHTTHLVGSALSDPFLCLAAGINGLAGPLHGLANQEVVRWIEELKDKHAGVPTRAELERYVRDTLNRGQVVPGYGHAVLRRTDPRYTAQREFALAHLPDDDNFKIVQLLYEVVPAILEEQGKAKNPWPNVDAHSGCLLIHYGVVEYDFYTVLFGVSRAMGVLASLVWDRALGLPLERPKSVTTDWIAKELGKE